MPIQNQLNIDLGIGTIEFGSYSNDVFGAYQDVGAVKANVTIEHQREVLPFETGRQLITIKQEVIRESVMFKATLAEVKLATVKMALGQADVFTSSIPTFLDGSSTAPRGDLQAGNEAVISGELLKFGGLSTHAFIGLRFTHRKSDGTRQIFEAYKASPMGNLTLPFNETDWNTFNVEFRLLADTTKVAGEQYYQMLREKTAND